MITIIKVFRESIRQAFQQLVGNKLRSFLSLLGITIGIFCIIGVQAAVDSLEDNVVGSLSELGDDLIFVSKMPMLENPRENYWKYLRRPNPSFKDYQFIKENVQNASSVDFHVVVGFKTAKYRSSYAEVCIVVAVTPEFDDLFDVDYDRGRWYNPLEYEKGMNKVIIGFKVAEQLFGPGIDPVGRKIKLMGQSVEVIGMFEQSGESLVNVMNFDEAIIIGYELAKKMANVKGNNPLRTSINVRAKDGVTIDQLKDELTGVLRQARRLKPKEDDNFAINSMSMLTDVLDGVFGALNVAGLLIGGFSIFVGIFSVANIMFVSVKERTSIIGIKKAIGAKRGVILLEFLVESIILCILGGVVGLLLVFILLKIGNGIMPFEIYLSINNILTGIILSIIIGILSGLIPAYRAANLDPVVAMRQ